ncbi:MAG: tagaturonate reductase [Cyclobacteriaceae bacterium]|nr:tagaturonate reductase [Cyclobacteriaceae bacterium]
MKELNRTTISDSSVRPVKILQFGEGNFLRAFVDWMIDILNEKTSFNGSVQIIQPIAQGMGDMINSQDGLYHVVLNGIKNGKESQNTRLITCVKGAINPFTDHGAFLKTAENPDLRFIVSNTTEAGINFDQKDTDSKTLAQTFPGKLTQLLFHRFQYYNGSPDKGLIIIPCELIEKNGENLKIAIIQYVHHWNLSSDFKSWIEDHNIFCNTLVDRIVPGFPKDSIGEIQQSTGYKDQLVVMAEPFHLWVIEGDAIVQKALPMHEAELDVKFVKDLTPYRTRKVRILNGAHTTLVPVAYLKGLRTVRESIEDPSTGNYLRKTIFEEIIPTLDLSQEELTQFSNDVIERFQNPFIRHELISISLNSISKYKVRVLPSVLKYIEIRNQLPARLLFSLAALIRFYKGNWNGEEIPLNDTPEVLQFFKDAWQSGSTDKIATLTLSNVSFWGQDLTQIKGLLQIVVLYLNQIESEKSLPLEGLTGNR